LKIFCRYAFRTILLGSLELTLYKCSIPVFDGLLPDDHNKIVIDLLFIMAHWHGLAKLRMHSDLTLDILDRQTTQLGEQLRRFKAKVCTVYSTQELNRELDARSRRQAKETAKRAGKDKAGGSQQGAAAQKPKEGANVKGKQKASPEQSQDALLPGKLRRKKSFNLQTYKVHALGDYVACIRRFGTTDSYSTEPVSLNILYAPLRLNCYQGELEHRMPKGRYRRTDRRDFIRQLTQIERRQARLRRIKQRQQKLAPRAELNENASDPRLQHHMGQSEKVYDEFGHYLRSRARDPAMKVNKLCFWRLSPF
jgi:hypothetical protein